MPTLEDGTDLSWFDAGSGVLDGILDEADYYPPLNNREAQREWLAGFGAAWCEVPDCPGLEPDPRRRALVEVLAWKLSDRPELLRQLLSIGTANGMLEFET